MIWIDLNKKKWEKDLFQKHLVELFNYILVPVRKTVGGLKVNVVSLFKTNTPKDYGKQTVYGKGKKSNNPKHKNNTRKT